MRGRETAVATVLTYHRIVPDGAREYFHDVEASPFEQQVRCIVERTISAENGARLIPGRGPVHLTFDDGTADHRHVSERLSSLGLTGTFFVITGRFGKPGYLSEKDIRSMAIQGHRIASHGVTHRHMTTMTPTHLTDELVSSRQHLQALTQRTVDWLAPPGGVYSQPVIDAALKVGYRVGRTMDWGYAELPLYGCIPCLPIVAQYDITMFKRLLDGRAPLWIGAMKNLIKRSIGPGMYTKMRDLSDKYYMRNN